MSYRLAVFDWDGTLMDSAARIVNCVVSAARDVGLEPPAADRIRRIIGLGLDDAFRELFPETPDEPLLRHLCDRYRDHFVRLDDTPMQPFAGVRDGLARLHQQGLWLAVATGKARRGLDRAFAETGLGDLFVASRCADEAFSKPHPRMLFDLLDDTGVDASQAVMIGDTSFDLQMARNARVDSLAVTYGVHDHGDLLACDPRACMDTFDEVVEWLEGKSA